jgi:hypothetical protein
MSVIRRSGVINSQSCGCRLSLDRHLQLGRQDDEDSVHCFCHGELIGNIALEEPNGVIPEAAYAI